MFTGIVQTKATVISFDGHNNFKTLILSVASEYLARLNIGASISINGVCLTVTQFEDHISDVVGQVQFDVIDETLEKTNLKHIRRGDSVNFERSVTFGTELGGHIVSGHIHDTVSIKQRVETPDNVLFTLAVKQEWMKYILYKGFVSINGCSLTVGEVTETGFKLHLIPETLEVTNLGDAKEGDALNLEVDQQTYTTVQVVERYLKSQKIGRS